MQSSPLTHNASVLLSISNGQWCDQIMHSVYQSKMKSSWSLRCERQKCLHSISSDVFGSFPSISKMEMKKQSNFHVFDYRLFMKYLRSVVTGRDKSLEDSYFVLDSSYNFQIFQCNPPNHTQMCRIVDSLRHHERDEHLVINVHWISACQLFS